MAADASSFWHELKSHDYDCDDGLCNSAILFLSVALAILFSGISARPKMCSEFTTAGEMAKLAMKIENHRASHCLLFRCLRKTLLFFSSLNIKMYRKGASRAVHSSPTTKKHILSAEKAKQQTRRVNEQKSKPVSALVTDGKCLWVAAVAEQSKLAPRRRRNSQSGEFF